MSDRRCLRVFPVQGVAPENLALLRQLAAEGVRLMPSSRFLVVEACGDLSPQLEAAVRIHAGQLQRLTEPLAVLREQGSLAGVCSHIGRLSRRLLPMAEEMVGPELPALLAAPERFSPALRDLLFILFHKGLARQMAGEATVGGEGCLGDYIEARS